jgi:hypothetical protein
MWSGPMQKMIKDLDINASNETILEFQETIEQEQIDNKASNLTTTRIMIYNYKLLEIILDYIANFFC